MNHERPNGDALLDALRLSLRDWEKDNPTAFDRWGLASHRTHIMKGDAVRKSANGPRVPKSANYLLADTLKRLGYSDLKTAKDKRKTVHREWRQLDLAAISCEENWNRDCWRGRYRADYLIEVENNLQEFVLTMRGLLDVRARVSCGIFFVPRATESLDSCLVGTGATSKERRTLGEVIKQWDSLTTVTHCSSTTELIAIFVSTDLCPEARRPVIVGHRSWTARA